MTARLLLLLTVLPIGLVSGARAQDDADAAPPPVVVPEPANVPQPPIARRPFQDWVTGPASVRRRAGRRLSSAPDMFGDSLRPGSITVPDEERLGRFPFSGGGTKIAENGRAAVSNRLIFDVRHFEGGLEILDGDFVRSRNFQRYTFGVEKVLDDAGTRSLEVRIPIIAGANESGETLQANGPPQVFDFNADGIRTIGVILKQELCRTENAVLSAGLGLGLPVRNDLEIRDDVSSSEFRIKPEAIHFQPFVGFLTTPTDDLFFQGFVQVDVPHTGDAVHATIFQRDRGQIGRINSQTLLYVDVAGGAWLFRNQSTKGLTGLAAVAELHYTTTLNDADVLFDSPSFLLIGNDANRLDLLQATLGLHATVGRRTAIRFGVVLPLQDGLDRVYDSELIGSLIHRF